MKEKARLLIEHARQDSKIKNQEKKPISSPPAEVNREDSMLAGMVSDDIRQTVVEARL